MDLIITGGFQHFQLTTEEENEISISTTRSNLLGMCTRAFKSTQRTNWKVGSDLRFVDMEIKVFQLMFSSWFHMEWLPFFCFICGVLGLGETECLWHFGGRTRKSNGFKEVFEKHCVASKGGSEEERMVEITGVQHTPVATSQAWLGMEQARPSMALSNHTSSNVVLSESQSNDALVCPLSPTPSSIVLSRVSQWSSLKGKEVVDKASDLGFPMSFSEAQISPSSEPTSIPSPFNEPINIPLCPKSGHLNGVARTQEKKPQNFNMQTQVNC